MLLNLNALIQSLSPDKEITYFINVSPVLRTQDYYLICYEYTASNSYSSWQREFLGDSKLANNSGMNCY